MCLCLLHNCRLAMISLSKRGLSVPHLMSTGVGILWLEYFVIICQLQT